MSASLRCAARAFARVVAPRRPFAMADKIPRSGADCHNCLSLSIAVQRRGAPRRENGRPQWLNEMGHYPVIPPRALSHGARRGVAEERGVTRAYEEGEGETEGSAQCKQREARSAGKGLKQGQKQGDKLGATGTATRRTQSRQRPPHSIALVPSSPAPSAALDTATASSP